MDRKLIRTVSIGQRQQPSKFQEIDEEKFYTIQCIFNGFCLRCQPKCFREGDYLRLTGNQLQLDYINQLWMFKKLSRTEYQLVHVKTDLVLTIEDFQGRLEVGRQKQNQKFEIVPFKNGFIRIRDNSNNGVMRLDGILETVQYNERDETQLFRLNSYGMFDVPWFKDTIFILTDDKTASLDLVNAARKDQRQIIVYRKNLRMNQRWKFTLLESARNKNYTSVHITSALTNMFVVLNKQSKGLMQASYPQEWLIEETEIKEYIYIRHAKLQQFLSYDEAKEVYFSPTKKNKWYVQNGMEGLHLKRSMLARTSIL